MDANITQSFIDMVEAYKAKPELESQIKQLRDDVEFFERNLRIEEDTSRSLREANANLMAQLEGVKKERDDAMFRSLELEDKFSGIEKLLGVAERLEQARKAEHQATVDALTPKPLVEAAVVTEQGSTIVEPSYTGPIDPVVVEPQGQSDSRPTSLETGNASETGTSDQMQPAPTEPSFDQYEESTWKGQPYGNKPWWAEDDVWYVAGGMLA
jgi:hypothetical protein